MGNPSVNSFSGNVNMEMRIQGRRWDKRLYRVTFKPKKDDDDDKLPAKPC